MRCTSTRSSARAGPPWPHVRWAEDADLLLVAPATANILGKFAHGIADDALSTLHLATRAPVVVAPAMNVAMWQHPTVVANLETLKARGVTVVEPGSGYLACGAVGEGRLAEVAEIVAAVAQKLGLRRDLSGVKVLVTAGPTREPIDPRAVHLQSLQRKDGYRLAEAARDRGASRRAGLRPTALEAPEGIETRVRDDGRRDGGGGRGALERGPRCRHGGAVCDHRPAQPSQQKVKKDAVRAPAGADREPGHPQTSWRAQGWAPAGGLRGGDRDVRAEAQRKLREKHLDLIVANTTCHDRTPASRPTRMRPS